MTDRPPIPEILAAHRRLLGGGRSGDSDYCSCGDWMASTIRNCIRDVIKAIFREAQQ